MFKVSLDAGHGGFGITPGKRCPDGSMYEWDFNSAVVKYMIVELGRYENIQTLRVDDPTGKTDVPLKTRTDKVNAWGSNVHVSVHANASCSVWSDAHGIETFVYETTLKDAVALANKVQASLIAATGLRNRGVKADDLHMVRETHMTSILCECGFMTNHQEADLLKSDDYRKKVAHAIVNGLAAHFNLQLIKKIAVKIAESNVVMWDGMELKKGQIGRLTILKPINLWNRIGDDIEMARVLQPGEVYRVYGYDRNHGGQYNVGGLFITKMDGYIKYETPSKALLAKL